MAWYDIIRRCLDLHGHARQLRARVDPQGRRLPRPELADAQKFYTLRIQKGLITHGMHRYVRHPNYLGEVMIYGSFAMMIWHWLPVLVLAGVWLGLFAVNMIMKEASMSRYPEWADYKQRTWWLVPYLI